MRENRQLQRHAVNKSAKVIFGAHGSLLDCTVLNLTSNGACLCFAATTRLPKSFELSFDSFRSFRDCRVVWTRTDKVGVCFR